MSKVYVGLELDGGLTVMQEVYGDLKENMIKWDEDTRANYLSDFLNNYKGKFISHGSRVVQVDSVISGFVEIRN